MHPAHAQMLQGVVAGNTRTAASGGLYYGPGCSGTLTNVCSVFGTDNAEDPAYIGGYNFVTGANAAGYSVKAGGQYFSAVAVSPNNVFKLAIYTGPRTGAVLLCESLDTTASVGWNEDASFGICPVLAANTPYTLVSVSKTGNTQRTDNGSANLYSYMLRNAFPTFPAGPLGTFSQGSFGSLCVKLAQN